MSKFIWWAYKHTDGGVHIKRCSEDFMFDMKDDAESSPFVDDYVFSPTFDGNRDQYKERLHETNPGWFL